MSVKCYETEYKNFGKCVCIENGKIRLIATIDFGPRIIFFGLCDDKNVLLEDTERNFSEDNGEYGKWYTYGGHRLWCAPELKPETYFPDNDPVQYAFKDDTLTLTPPATPFGKQYIVAVKMGAANSVSVENKIINTSDKPAMFAPWSITALTTEGIEIIPLNKEETGFLPNRTMALWSYDDLYDSRFRLFNDAAILSQSTSTSKAFKVGFNVTDGYVGYACKDRLFIKTFGRYTDVRYPDYSCNFETYTNKYFLECEVVGEYREYQPGEEAVISETWKVFPFDRAVLPLDESAVKIIEKYAE